MTGKAPKSAAGKARDDTPHPLRDPPSAARRALAEAEARRRQRVAQEQPPPREIGGRDGPEPVRYGDWEVKGIASDF